MRRAFLAPTAIDIDVLMMALGEAEMSARSSDQVYETPAHREAAKRLKTRLTVLYRQLMDDAA